KSHDTNDTEFYSAKSLCNKDETAIGGQGSCLDWKVGAERPSMVSYGRIQRIDGGGSEGWAIGCKGKGSAIVEAMCVKI
ncbi:MAG: hypothetical protein AABX39_06110, partial [Nanoarchaeota archaeon]